MPQERLFHAPGVELRPLADDLAQWLKGRQFETQVLPVEGGGVLIQARQEGGWRSVVGMALATNVVVSRAGANIKVEVGQGKWLDKAVVGAVGMLLLWPALIPAAIGAWQQSKLPEEIFSHVAAFVAVQPPAPVEAAAAGQVACPNCGQMVSAEAKFCEHCGQALPQQAPKPKHCSNCGAELSPTAKFCGECGKPVEA